MLFRSVAAQAVAEAMGVPDDLHDAIMLSARWQGPLPPRLVLTPTICDCHGMARLAYGLHMPPPLCLRCYDTGHVVQNTAYTTDPGTLERIVVQ